MKHVMMETHPHQVDANPTAVVLKTAGSALEEVYLLQTLVPTAALVYTKTTLQTPLHVFLYVVMARQQVPKNEMTGTHLTEMGVKETVQL